MNVGIDIVEIKRIAQLIRKKRFLDRVYTRQEIAYCRTKKRVAQHFAVRFAAKEAVWKALHKPHITHKDIGVHNQRDGRPEVRIRGKRNRSIDISLSHSNEHAIAIAVIK